MPGDDVPKPPIDFGVVGCGAIVREMHLPILTTYSDVAVRILMDKDPRSAEMAKKEYGISAVTTTNLDGFRGNVSAALVAVPPRFHAPVSIELMEMGIDVLCEKPLATNVKDAKAMIEVAERKQRILAVGLMTRFHRNNPILRELTVSGELGEIREVVAEMGDPLDWTMTTASYYSKESTAGGVFFDAGVHLLDRVLWLFGDFKILDFEDDSFGGVESNAVLLGTLRIEGRDVPCRFSFSWTHKLNNSIRVIGSLATAEAKLSNPDTVYVSRKVGSTRVVHAIAPEDVNGSGFTPSHFRSQIRDFVHAVRARQQPFVPASSTVGALQLIEDAYSIRRRMAQPWVETTGSSS